MSASKRLFSIWGHTGGIGTLILMLLLLIDSGIKSQYLEIKVLYIFPIDYLIIFLVTVVFISPTIYIYRYLRKKMLSKPDKAAQKIAICVVVLFLIFVSGYFPALFFAELANFSPHASYASEPNMTKIMTYLVISYGAPFIYWILTDNYDPENK